MVLSGERVVAAPVEVVWAGMRNIAIVKASIGGCEQVIRSSDTEMAALISRKQGSRTTCTTANASFADIQPPSSCRIACVLGRGGINFAELSMKVQLAQHRSGTCLRYEADLAFLQRATSADALSAETSAGAAIDQFFASFSEAVARSRIFYPSSSVRVDANLVRWAELLIGRSG